MGNVLGVTNWGLQSTGRSRGRSQLRPACPASSCARVSPPPGVTPGGARVGNQPGSTGTAPGLGDPPRPLGSTRGTWSAGKRKISTRHFGPKGFLFSAGNCWFSAQSP
ncbi:hypothetical protein KIL84_020872 [Mauremys mutica]|uniref:Uncharacterized protein n=1 Tax=Mauremys mutica TaxID=74926 RepID=A0A9D3XB52_9SAUR|nr:hypothetical protein KIL84_020872 [Mauremys mutica]